MEQNSLSVYREISLNGVLNSMQKFVLAAIVKHPNSSDKEISEYTGLPINCVTPRRGELASKNLIYSSGSKINNKNHAVKLWEATA